VGASQAKSAVKPTTTNESHVKLQSRPLTSNPSIVTLDEKIGKVISEIKHLNKQKAERYGIGDSIGNSSKTR
jgi:hypothetical protein